jgi:oligopeptide/dipeptide ABC transporter ATP-binding protein
LPSRDDATRKLRSGSREPLLRVEGLSVQLPVKQGLLRRTVGQVQALDSVDLRVLRGQTLAVVGEAGAGKTTLARSITGQLTSRVGKVLFEGKDLIASSKAELRQALRQIQLITPELLAGPDLVASFGGAETKLLILDEAVDALDAVAQLRVFDELRRLQEERGLTCLLLTRSLQLAGALADEIVVLHAGQVVETGAPASLLSQPHHPYTRLLLEPAKAAGTAPALPPDTGVPRSVGCRFRGRCPQVFARCAEGAPALVAVTGGLSRCFLHDADADSDADSHNSAR